MLDKKRIIKGKKATSELCNIINDFHLQGPISSVDLEKLAYIKRFHPKIFEQYESKILHLMGLFYKPIRPNSLIELIYNAYSKNINTELNNFFTPLQANALKNINSKRYFSFSAPTSSGKSFLFMDLIKNKENDIVIVVPSRALIAEYMEKVLEIVKDRNDILVLQFVENINKKYTQRRIFILTPERAKELFRFKDVLSIELFLFDEAQLSEEEIRGLTFDSLVRRVDKVFPRATKVFAHPFISNPDAQLVKHNFDSECASKNYLQNSVGKMYLTPEALDIFAYRPTFKPAKKYFTRNIIKSTLKKPDTTILIYTSKSKIYAKKHLDDFKEYVDLCPLIENKHAKDIIKELEEYIGASKEEHKSSLLIEMMRKGIVIHHGSIPLKARFLIEKFVNNGFAKICFATSTLIQGINMPFDAVWIDNYRFPGSQSKRALALKNLIGRAGRNKANKNEFDYGYVIIPKKNYQNFLETIHINATISNESGIDNEDISQIDQDILDIVEATKNDSFDDLLQITEAQKERLRNSNVDLDIKFVLDNIFIDNEIINEKNYNETDPTIRDNIKEAFKNIFIKHLRRPDLSPGEQSVLSVALRILLWKIEGRSFSQIVAFRHLYITQIDEQRKFKKLLKLHKISEKEYRKLINSIKLKYSQVANQLPKVNIAKISLFKENTTLKDFDYDKLVYDTYDYLDEVISLSLSSPLSAAFQMYFDKTNDNRAKSMVNYLKYGTDDYTEIMLLRYGFEFEDIDWLKIHVEKINEDEIVFLPAISTLGSDKQELIARYNHSEIV